MRFVVGVGLLLIVAPSVALAATAPSLDDRVAARRAVEDVLWRHRLWPADNAEPKPPLSAVLSDAEIRARVTDDLRKSKALDVLWHHPVTAAMLDAELDRMRAASRAPEVLTEMLSAIGNDPALAREAIARPALVDRLMRSWYAQDARYHSEEKLAAERGSGGTVVEVDWEEADGSLEAKLDRLVDEENAFRSYRVIGRRDGKTRVAVTSWPKRSLESFWAENAASFSADSDIPSGESLGRSPDAPLVVASCANDTWHPLGNVTPGPRSAHTAVWTGSEMIVWGGTTPGGTVATGGRYAPATDSWYPMSSAGAPSARMHHDAVWTGSEMIVWGGQQLENSPWNLLGDGAKYNPLSDTWSPISNTGAPSARREATLVWTGSRAVVFGGRDTTLYLNTGGLYDPVSNTWTSTSMTGAPGVRGSHTAVWTGSRMIIWGGFDDFGDLQTGGRFDPVANSWQPTSMTNVPPGRKNHTAVWTGSRMIVWGGYESLLGSVFDDGSSYDPVTDGWSAISHVGMPDKRQEHTAVWTGSLMIVWGGSKAIGDEYFDGGRYDPASNTWTPIAGGPVARHLHTAVWTGSEMVVWGGVAEPYPPGSGTFYYDSGGRYAPSSDSWVPTSVKTTGPPSARASHTAVWTGAETIFWGGSVFNNGGRYVSATDSWIPTTTSGAPAARSSHTAVWTGTAMIVWGGDDTSFQPLGTGGRYNPAADTWAGVSIVGAPNGVSLHTAVWTGSRMIVWGGRRSGILTNEGGLYDPSTDSWTATSVVNAPDPRYLHSAVWTGSRLVVWGGSDLFGIASEGVNTGGRYDPASNTWTATSTISAPQGRAAQVAVWTGSSMIVWGGNCCFDGTILNTGGRYDPVGDSWSATSTIGAPTARNYASASWTGFEMIVWGGIGGGGRLNTGGRYRPANDAWTPTTLTGAPAVRDFHTGTWAGDKMIVFGGIGAGGGAIDTGASYCACVTIYRDEDGDGWGNTFNVDASCDGTVPSGYSLNPGDCSDSVPTIHPGVPDNNCNAVDEDCSGTPDDQWIGGLSHCGVGVCRANGFFECTGGQIINNCTPGTPLDVFDTSCNNLDDDCDGATDEEFIQWPDTWSGMPAGPQSRTNHTTVWSGSEMIVFGGDNGSGIVKAGGEAYAPGTNTWRTLAAGPAKRWRHTAVWTGSRMVVWGGDDNVATVYNTGSRYDPATNTWAATTTTGAPTARTVHSSVWTGSQVIVWGGTNGVSSTNTGSRYDPVGNAWSATTTTGAPTARAGHSAVWTGSVMIIWGGLPGLATGSRYDPAANSWSAVASAGSFAGRYGHIAVWTGSEMIIWGGTDGSSYFANGARYNPATNGWASMSNSGAPAARAFASAAWTGSELIVWGGVDGAASGDVLQDGARYNPSTNTWTVMTPVGEPDSRGRAGAVWTGSELVVWGGDPNGGAWTDGGRYTPVTICGTGGCQQTGHRVCSGGVASYQCVALTPAPEVCDGLDNDCDVAIDEGIPVPVGHPALTLGKLGPPSQTLFSWSVVSDTTGYDVVRGWLSTLRITSGDFTFSMDNCAFNDLTATQFQEGFTPPSGDAFWYLVRAVNACSGVGTYDDAVPPQAGLRDAEIAAAPGACP